MMDLDLRRRFFAEELEAVVKLRSAALVDAFAAVPRERFLRPGPWTVLSDSPDSSGSNQVGIYFSVLQRKALTPMTLAPSGNSSRA